MPLLVALCALTIATIASANPFRWTTYTSASSVRNLLVTDAGLWLGTTGGLVSFDRATGEFDVYTNTRGLAMNATVGLGEDQQGWIWIVAPDGRLTRLNPRTGQTKVISDLQNEIFEVSSIVRVGEEMFLGANNGIYRFAYYGVVDNYRVLERVRVLGSFPTSIAVADLVAHDGFLYAATIAGLARAPLTSAQFSAPAVWENYTLTEGLPANNVEALGLDGQRLWLATESQTASFDGTNFSTPISAPEAVLEFVGFDGQFYAISENTLYRFAGNAWTSTGLGQPGLAAVAVTALDGVNILAIGVADRSERPGGLRFFDGADLSPIIAPRGVGGNAVTALTFDSIGDLWVASQGARTGVSKFSHEQWTAYTRSDTLGGLFWNSGPRSAVADNYGGVWFGSDGGGVIRHHNGEFYRYNSIEDAGFDQDGPRLSGISGSPSFCVTRVGKLPSGDILISNRLATVPRTVAVVTNDWLSQGNNPTPWAYYRTQSESGIARPYEINEIFGDPFGRIFVGASFDGNHTFVCDPAGTLADTSNDQWASYDPVELQDAATTCFEDINREVLSFAVDKQKYLWVGTPGGAYYSQGGLTHSGNPQDSLPDDIANLRFICLFDLPIGRRVNHIHVDAQDNKWFATDEGVAVLDPSFSWVHVFQTSSSIDFASDLASENVTSITSNPSTGEVWIGTLDGLSRLETPYVTRERTLDEVWPYPNPFIADGTQHMYLDANALGGRFDELRVFTLTGRLVRELAWSTAISTGWDGRNEDGELVAGGVYLLVATTSDGHSATGKLAVLGR